jgi:pseudouridine kinase
MSETKRPKVVGVGAANVDVHGRSRRPIVMRDSNPGYMATSVGGVTRNILENLARQGMPVALLSAVGTTSTAKRLCATARLRAST